MLAQKGIAFYFIKCMYDLYGLESDSDYILCNIIILSTLTI